MNEVWKILLSLSISGTVLIVGIFLLCRMFGKKLSKRWQYYIWLAAVARLLIPWPGEINLVGQALSRAEQYAEQRTASDEAGLPESVSIEAASRAKQTDAAQSGPPAASAADPPKEANALHLLLQKKTWFTRLAEYAGLLWLTVTVILLLRKIIGYQRFLRDLRAGSTPAAPELLEPLGQMVDELRIREPVELLIHPLAPSPLLVGCLHPAVVLPAAELTGEEFRYTVLHELTHHRRRDLLYKWLIQLTVCLHWFNPFVWLLGRETDRACELSCDEAVIRKLTEEEKRAYGDILLRAAERGGALKSGIPAVTLHESARLLKGRLEAIAMIQKKTTWAKVLTLALTVTVAGTAAALGAYAKPQEEEAVPFTGGDCDFLLEDGTGVIRQGQVFYILCDGLTEEDIPFAGVVDGTMIVVAHRNRIASVTLPGDKNLSSEADEICQEMVRQGTLPEADAARVVETAEKMEKGEAEVPLSHLFFDGSYYQSAYYRAPYLFFVGYDLTEDAAARYAGADLALENGEQLRVYFTDACQRWKEDETFLSMLQTLFSEFRTREGRRVSRIQRPIISSVEEVGEDAEGLAEAYYSEGDVGRFSVMVTELSADSQKEYVEKAFREEDAAIFSIILGELEQDGTLEQKLLDAYLSKAREEQNVAFFAILTDYLSEAAAQEWYDRISREGSPRSPYDVILWEHLHGEEADADDVWEDADWDW